MKRVTPKGAGVKLNGKWCFIGQEDVISEEEYKANKEYLTVLEDISETNERVIEIIVKDETIDIETLKSDIEKYIENYNKPNEQDNPGEDNTGEDNTGEDNPGEDNPGEDNPGEDEELEALKEKAKKLGIKNIHNMKKETLIKKISEIE